MKWKKSDLGLSNKTHETLHDSSCPKKQTLACQEKDKKIREATNAFAIPLAQSTEGGERTEIDKRTNNGGCDQEIDATHSGIAYTKENFGLGRKEPLC